MRYDGTDEIETLDKAAWHILEAVQALRVYISENRLEPHDPEAQYINGKIAALSKLADKLSPPQHGWTSNVVPFTRSWKA